MSVIEALECVIDKLEKVVVDYGKTIGEQRNELADQRRTMATLRARLQNRKGGYWSRGKQQDHWLDGWRNRYDALRTGYINLSPTCDGYSSREAKARHRQRIAAIRNFGSLPGEPLMPMYFWGGLWQSTCWWPGAHLSCETANIKFDLDSYTEHRWTSKFRPAGVEKFKCVIHDSYQGARREIEKELRKLRAIGSKP